MNYVLSEEEYQALKKIGDAASVQRAIDYQKQVESAQVDLTNRLAEILGLTSAKYSTVLSSSSHMAMPIKEAIMKFNEAVKPFTATTERKP